MKRTKHPKYNLPKPKTGPKSKCTREVIQQAYRLCLLGLSDKELAVAFNVDTTTVSYWKKTNTHFKQAVEKGRKFADGEVAEALFERALGYQHPATKFFKNTVTEKEYDEEGNVIREKSYTDIIKVPYIKQYPPDTKAAIKFLGVRNRETWGESYKVEHKHAHMHVGEVQIHQFLDQLGDTEMFSDEELKVAAKLGLSKAANEITNGHQN